MLFRSNACLRCLNRGQPVQFGTDIGHAAGNHHSARAFDRVSRVSAAPRLFLLGGMAELGPTSAQLHRDCGAQLPLRSGDHVVVFGGESAALLQGVALPGVELSVAASVEDVAARVAAHRGFVFLKGSRSFALERCLPDSLRSALSFH